MDEALGTFARWQAAVAETCAAAGYWCDAADPSSGFCFKGPRGERWNEVKAAHWLLGYPLQDEDSICPRLLHPSFGRLLEQRDFLDVGTSGAWIIQTI